MSSSRRPLATDWLRAVLETPGLTSLRDPAGSAARARRRLAAGRRAARGPRRPDRRRRLRRRCARDPARARAAGPRVRPARVAAAEVRASSSIGRRSNARVVCGRAEEQGTDWAGAAVAKALAPPPVAAEWCLPLVRPGGAVVLFVGPRRGCRRRRRVGGADRRRRARGPRRAAAVPEGDRDASGLPPPPRDGPQTSAHLIWLAATATHPTPRGEGRAPLHPPPAWILAPGGVRDRALGVPILCRFRGSCRGAGRPTPKKECSSDLTHLCAREPEGRRRQDDDCRQPCRLPRRGGRDGRSSSTSTRRRTRPPASASARTASRATTCSTARRCGARQADPLPEPPSRAREARPRGRRRRARAHATTARASWPARSQRRRRRLLRSSSSTALPRSAR